MPITHRFQLTKVMHQFQTDKLFVAALKDVRLGMYSSESGTFISQLARELAPQLVKSAMHIFSKMNARLLLVRRLVFHP